MLVDLLISLVQLCNLILQFLVLKTLLLQFFALVRVHHVSGSGLGGVIHVFGSLKLQAKLMVLFLQIIDFLEQDNVLLHDLLVALLK